MLEMNEIREKQMFSRDRQKLQQLTINELSECCARQQQQLNDLHFELEQLQRSFNDLKNVLSIFFNGVYENYQHFQNIVEEDQKSIFKCLKKIK